MSNQQLGFEARIAPELAAYVRPINSFTEHPDNARTHKIDKIAASLQAHGQRSLVVVQKSSGHIVKGNGTHEAAMKLGWLEMAFDEQDMDDTQAMAYLLADNRASDESKYNRKKLIANLERMVEGPGLTGTLFEIDELDDLIAEEDAVPVAAVAAFTGGFNENEEAAAARAAAGKAPGDKRREVPLVFSLEQHALFLGWLKTLQKRWNVTGTMATVFAAVKRQAEAEDAGVVPVTGEPLSEDVRVAERRAALREFRDLIITMGGATREFRGSWLLGQIQGAMEAQKASAPVAGGSTPAPTSEREVAAQVLETFEVTPEEVGLPVTNVTPDEEPSVAAILAVAAAASSLPPAEPEPDPADYGEFGSSDGMFGEFDPEAAE